MRGNIGEHDPRFADLAIIIVLLIAVVGAVCYYSMKPMSHKTTAFIVPG